MPITSVQLYIRDLVQGQASPLLQPAEARVSPLVPGVVTVPQIHVWASDMEEHRQTMPRADSAGPATGGYKYLTYGIRLWVVWIDKADNPQIDQAFPELLDAIMSTLRSTVVPAVLRDPQTNVQSQVFMVGEQMTVRYATPRGMGSEGELWQSAEITCQVKELLQA